MRSKHRENPSTSPHQVYEPSDPGRWIQRQQRDILASIRALVALLGGVVDLSLSLQVVESVDGLAGLHDWLRREPEFRGRVQSTTRPSGPNELGTLPDVLTVALGSGGAITALAASLKVFLGQPRRSDVRITINASDGRSVEIDAKRVNDVEALIHSAFDYPA